MQAPTLRGGARLVAGPRIVVFWAAALMGLLCLVTGGADGLDHALRDLRDEIRSRPASGPISC